MLIPYPKDPTRWGLEHHYQFEHEQVQRTHARVPTRVLCPPMHRTCLFLGGSQICTMPKLVPTAKYDPRCVHATEQTVSLGPKSHSLVTLLVQALHRYTHVPRPTASVLLSDQSTRLR